MRNPHAIFAAPFFIEQLDLDKVKLVSEDYQPTFLSGCPTTLGSDKFTDESYEYVKGLIAECIQQFIPDDFVIGTGQTHSVREFMQIVFEELKLNYEDYLVIDPRFYRPAEVEILVADPSKAKEKLGWEPRVTFAELALKMIRYDYDILKKR